MLRVLMYFTPACFSARRSCSDSSALWLTLTHWHPSANFALCSDTASSISETVMPYSDESLRNTAASSRSHPKTVISIFSCIRFLLNISLGLDFIQNGNAVLKPAFFRRAHDYADIGFSVNHCCGDDTGTTTAAGPGFQADDLRTIIGTVRIKKLIGIVVSDLPSVRPSFI